MNRNEVIEKLLPVMQDVFDEDDLAYADNLSAADIEEWDSLSHIRFMVAVERKFDIRFSTGEIEQFHNVGELVDAILAKKSR